jgi:hypothetical protein
VSNECIDSASSLTNFAGTLVSSWNTLCRIWAYYT